MIRRTLYADVDDPLSVETAEVWLGVHRDALTSAEESGCGCCVLMWRLEGPADVLATIPVAVTIADPAWDTREVRRSPHGRR